MLGRAGVANSTSDCAPRTIDLLAFWAFPPIVSIHTYTFKSRDAAQNAPQAIRRPEDDIVGLALEQRRPPACNAFVQQLAVPVGRAQSGGAEFTDHLFLLALPNSEPVGCKWAQTIAKIYAEGGVGGRPIQDAPHLLRKSRASRQSPTHHLVIMHLPHRPYFTRRSSAV